MNFEQANRILDRHKEGSHAYSLLTISKALYLTGDLGTHEELRGSGMVGEIPGESLRTWSDRGETLVEQDHF
jgi:hypothetical protein